MDSSHPSDACCIWIDLVGPFDDYETLVEALGKQHPVWLRETETLHYHDGPIIMTGHVGEDARPRLDVLVLERHEGEAGRRVYVTVRHQLVFDSHETLHASLSHERTPTRQSYQLADQVVRYAMRSTQMGHPLPSHSMCTVLVSPGELPLSEMPQDEIPIGLAVPCGKQEKDR